MTRPPQGGGGEQDASDDSLAMFLARPSLDASAIPDDVLKLRRRWVFASAVIMIGLVTAGLGAAALIKSPAQEAANAAKPPADTLTSPVERRTLKETVVLRGVVAARQSAVVTVAGPTGEDAARMVVTRAPIRSGQKIAAGEVVLEISGRPIVALEGSVPMYRDLRPGARGDDVARLQRALGSLGYDRGYDEEGHFGPGTKVAVTNFYRALGYDPVPAQADGDEAILAADDGVLQAQRAVEDASKGRAKARARQDLDRSQKELAKVRSANGPMVAATEVVFLRSFPARVASTSVGLGDEVTSTAMTISSGELVVTTSLQPSQKGLIREGMRAEILSEASGKSYPATVGSVADALPGSQAGEADEPTSAQVDPVEQGYAVVVVAQDRLPSKVFGQGVRVTVEAAATQGEALVVPVTAISAGADAKTIVTVVTSEGDRRKVEVLIGTNGDGFVEVTPVAGSKLAEGEQVLTGVKELGTEGQNESGSRK